MGHTQIGTAAHDAHGLLYIAQRDIMMAARHPVLEKAACESACIEPLSDVTSFMGHRKHCISAARTDDDATSVRISCRIDLENRLLIFVSMRIF